MNKTSQRQRQRGTFDTMQHAMGRGGQEAVMREALERVDGKPTPVLGPMQVAMSSEAHIRLIHDVVRSYLDEHRHASTGEWAQDIAGSVTKALPHSPLETEQKGES